MDTFAKRLLWAREQKELSQEDLAKLIGVSQSTIGNYEAGLRNNPRKITKLAECLGVSAKWLEEGVGSPNGGPANNIYGIKGATPVAAIFDDEDEPGAVRIRKVKLRLSAGIAGFAIEQAEEEANPIFFRKNWLAQRGFNSESLIAIRVKGPSMEPGLHEDDTVVINTADKMPKDGEVFAVNYEGEAVVKRMIRDYGFWWLSSDNPDQSRFPRKRCEGDACIIIGRVIHKQSERI